MSNSRWAEITSKLLVTGAEGVQEAANTMKRIMAVLVAALAFAGVAAAQNMYPLQMMTPVAPGAAGTGWDASNRIYRAYPGIPYSITATARGGHWPYTYSLTNAPAGMTIQAGPCATIGPSCTAGTITWANPQSSASNISVQVCDVERACVTGTWSITVSNTIGADGFCFISGGGNDTTGNGSLAAPWSTIAKAWSSCGARSILYLRTGTYATTGMTESNFPGYGLVVAVTEERHPVIWLGYPGDRPVVDFGSTGTGDVQILQMGGSNIWIDGLEATNIGNQGFQLGRSNRYGAVIRNNYFHNLRNGVNGNNSAFVMWDQNYELPSMWDIVQGNVLDNVAGTAANAGAVALKFYSVASAVIEHNTFSNSPFNDGILALKAEVHDYTVRANIFNTNVMTGIGGNMNSSPGGDMTGGEIYHNLSIAIGPVYDGALTLGVARVRPLGAASMWRNTFIGLISIDWIGATDGPFTFSNNVMVNAGGSGGACPQPLYCMSTVASYTPLIVNANNLIGPNDGTIVDPANGALTSGFSNYLGTRGYQFGPAVAGAVPSKPRGLLLH